MLVSEARPCATTSNPGYLSYIWYVGPPQAKMYTYNCHVRHGLVLLFTRSFIQLCDLAELFLNITSAPKSSGKFLIRPTIPPGGSV